MQHAESILDIPILTSTEQTQLVEFISIVMDCVKLKKKI